MNRWEQLGCVALACSAMTFFGCDDSGSTPSTPAAPAAPSSPEVPETPDTDTVKEEMQEHAEAAEEHVEALAADAEAQSSALMQKAQPLLDQAVAYAKENKYDLADKALTQIEGMEGLPESFMSKVTEARSMLDAKKKMDQAQGAGEQLQGMMGN